MGLKSGGLRSSLRNVSQVAAIPDSVVHQYPVSTFGTSTWTDDVGTADMTVNGMSASTFSNGEDSVAGDGTDDYGQANAPEDLPQNETFGVAFSVETTDDGLTAFWGVLTANAEDRFYCILGGTDQVAFTVSEGGNILEVQTTTTVNDGTPHLIVLNKSSNDASDMDIYVDDMATPATDTVEFNGAFDHTAYPSMPDMTFYARDYDGIQDYTAMDMGFIEFSTAPYSQSEREELKDRRPEV